MEGAHDLGGIGGFGSVRTDDGELTHHEPWELRAQMLALAVCHGARPWIERIDPPTYLTTSYYGRWLLAAERAAVANDVVSSDTLEGWQRRVRSGEAPPVVRNATLREREERAMTTPSPIAPARHPQLAIGEIVRVKRTYEPHRHHRIPRYVRGVAGMIEAICGEEHVAGYRANELEPFYTVRFSSLDVWGGRGDEPPYFIHVDLWQSYLDRAGPG